VNRTLCTRCTIQLYRAAWGRVRSPAHARETHTSPSHIFIFYFHHSAHRFHHHIFIFAMPRPRAQVPRLQRAEGFLPHHGDQGQQRLHQPQVSACATAALTRWLRRRAAALLLGVSLASAAAGRARVPCAPHACVCARGRLCAAGVCVRACTQVLELQKENLIRATGNRASMHARGHPFLTHARMRACTHAGAASCRRST
jgi:hypothetical protein